ncbi:probable outer membrane protein STY1784 [Hydrogenimonas sp.]|nr:probable outer membrane protein STY1784 [Hydrogenimonas sp.]
MKKALLSILPALPLLAYIDVTPIEIGEHPGTNGSIALSLSNTRGNTDKTEMSGDLNIRYDSNESFALWFFGGYKYTDTEGKSIQNKGSAHLRYLHRIYTGLYFESFVQSENNRINGIKNRSVAGADLRWRIFDTASYGRLYTAAGAILEQIRFIQPQVDPMQHNIRLSSYLFYTKAFDTEARLNAYIYYQPKIGGWSDFNLYSLAELQTPVYRNFFLLFSLTYNYDSTPPRYNGVESADMEQKVSLLWKF